MGLFLYVRDFLVHAYQLYLYAIFNDMNLKSSSSTKIPNVNVIDEINAELQLSQIAPGIQIGVLAPDFSLPDENNNVIQLSQELKKGVVVLSFYRGSWCRFCRAEFQSLQHNLAAITELGAIILGIGPQHPKNALNFVEKLELGFNVLSDINQDVIKAYNLHFVVHKKIQDNYINNYNLDLSKKTANRTWELPVPATFIIDKNGIIRDRFVNMNYKIRMEPKNIIKSLKTIQNTS